MFGLDNILKGITGNKGNLFGTLGGIAGDMFGGPFGGMIGQFAGSALGGQIFDMFKQNPLASLMDQFSPVSQMANQMMNIFNINVDYRTLAQFAQNPQGAIQDVLQNGFDQIFQPVGKNGLAPEGPSLTTNGNTIDTGRYLVSCSAGEVKVLDKNTNTWIDASGDPHLHTSDGDAAQFQENLTIDLEDGTKLKIKTTPKNAQGIALIDAVAVEKGNQAVLATGFQGGLKVGNVLNNANAVDQQWTDGTVLRAGHQIDDLSFAADGKEIVGGDPNQRFGEIMLDGHGGKSVNRAQLPPATQNAINAAAAQTGLNLGDDVGFESIVGILMKVLSDARKDLYDTAGKLQTLMKNRPKADDQDATNAYEDQKQTLTFKLQELQNQVQQFTTAITNVMKSLHDSQMAIVSNVK